MTTYRLLPGQVPPHHIGTPHEYQENVNSAQIDFDTVWYASYGSNLYPGRLMVYLDGGSVPGSNHVYLASQVQAPLGGRFTAKLPFSLVFGDESKIWGGSKAFLDPVPLADPDQHSIAALYKMSRQQFNHVVWQENWQAGLSSARSLDLEAAARTIGGSQPTGYDSSYNLLLFCGYALGDRERNIWHPVFTFTREQTVADGANIAPPSERYLRFIAAGLRTSTRLHLPTGSDYVMPDDKIVEYLHRAPGADRLTDLQVRLAVRDHLPEEHLSEFDARLTTPEIIVPGVVPFAQWEGPRRAGEVVLSRDSQLALVG